MSGKTADTKYGGMVDGTNGPDRSRLECLPEVHRSTDEFPAGDECDLTVDDVPDDEDTFNKTEHYVERRANRSDPNVTQCVIDRLLTDSTVREAPSNHEFDHPRYLFQAEIGGYEWTLVVADDSEDDSEWALISVYSNYHGSTGTTNKYLDRLRERREG
jgi:hypothetical protein